jgi:hypothetical protein
MRFPVLALLLVLTACSEFPLPDWARSDSGGSSDGSVAGSVAAPADELGSCQEQARAMIQRDQAIDQDIYNQDTNTDLVQGAGDLNRNLNEYNSKNRYDRIVDACMAARGYDTHNPNVKPVEQEGTPPAAPSETAPAVAPEQPSSGINPALPTYP